MKSEAFYFTSQAWVQGAWAKDVLLTVAPNGTWHSVQPNATPAQQVGATQLGGPVLPGLVNAHSHAFQRAIVGLTERRSLGADASDDFWSWRDRMYSAANRVTPDQLEAIASLLYAELLAGGYTHVCEFQYLHNDIDGRPYANPVEMSLAQVRAAQHTGIGLTLLPTLYMRSGFTAGSLRADQRRFASTPDSVMRVVEDVQRQTAQKSRAASAHPYRRTNARGERLHASYRPATYRMAA
jgi:formimidoylglutamate deiminase